MKKIKCEVVSRSDFNSRINIRQNKNPKMMFSKISLSSLLQNANRGEFIIIFSFSFSLYADLFSEFSLSIATSNLRE